MALALRLSTSVLLTSTLLFDAAVLATANQDDSCSITRGAVEDERVQLAATCLFVAQKDMTTGASRYVVEMSENEAFTLLSISICQLRNMTSGLAC